MNKLELHLRNGAVVVVDAVEVAVNRRTDGGGYTSIEWTTPDGWSRKLLSVELNAVVAVVAIAENKDTP